MAKISGSLGLSLTFLLSSQAVASANELQNPADTINRFPAQKSLLNSQETSLNYQGNSSLEIVDFDADFTTEANDLLKPTITENAEGIAAWRPAAESLQLAQTEEAATDMGQTAADDTEIAQVEDSDSGIPGEFSGSVTFTTNYVFRGISQSDNNPAIQGTLDYGISLSDKVGVYAGIFGSNVDFNDGDEASVEIDLYTGVAYQPTEKLSTDFTAFYYLYPGASSSLNYDYFEFVANAYYDLETVALGAGVAYSPDNFGSTGDAFYLGGNVTVPLPQNFSLNAAIGYQTIEDNAAFGAPDYVDWSLGVGYSVAGFDFALQYTDTDLSSEECFGGTDLCDARAIFSVSRSL